MYNLTMKKTLNGAQLKWIALITMFLDHLGAIVIQQKCFELGLDVLHFNQHEPWIVLYWGLRLIGRVAFPIFVYLLVEGFKHTRNRLRYGLTLLLFFVLSEIPFDLALFDQVIEFSHQNIYLTLFFGFLLMSLLNTLESHYEMDSVQYKILSLLSFGFIGFLNEILGADYGFYGILLVFILYSLRNDEKRQLLVYGFVNLYQLTASLSSLLLLRYNGQRGKQVKYFFYLFYPLHLLLLYWMVK